MEIKFTTPGKPRGKQRPKVCRINSKTITYTPKQTTEYEKLVRVSYTAVSKMFFDKNIPLEISITALFSVPQSIEISPDIFDADCVINKKNSSKNGETNTLATYIVQFDNDEQSYNKSSSKFNIDNDEQSYDESDSRFNTDNYQISANNPKQTTYKNNYNNNSISSGNNDDHLIVGKEIEDKRIEDIVSIPEDEIKSVTIRDGVKSISAWTFADCTGLKEVTVPKSAKIADSAFDRNTIVHKK